MKSVFKYTIITRHINPFHFSSSPYINHNDHFSRTQDNGCNPSRSSNRLLTPSLRSAWSNYHPWPKPSGSARCTWDQQHELSWGAGQNCRYCYCELWLGPQQVCFWHMSRHELTSHFQSHQKPEVSFIFLELVHYPSRWEIWRVEC